MNLKNRNLAEIFSDSPSSVGGFQVTGCHIYVHNSPSSSLQYLSNIFFLFSSTEKRLNKKLIQEDQYLLPELQHCHILISLSISEKGWHYSQTKIHSHCTRRLFTVKPFLNSGYPVTQQTLIMWVGVFHTGKDSATILLWLCVAKDLLSICGFNSPLDPSFVI